MRKLSSLIFFLVLAVSLLAQKSPHGETFSANCEDCHKTDGWKVDLKTISFNHNETRFPLVGQHQIVSCKQCHTSLEFAKAQSECNGCHTDIHEQTVGQECARCHTPNSWVVTNITRLHQQSRFPLVGPHVTADCKDCHINLAPSAAKTGTASLLRFDPLGVECYDCHSKNFIATSNPNHVRGNYSKNCTDCHSMNSYTWTGAGITHDFFPLTGGHATSDCNKCHSSGVYTGLSKECVSCHQPDYQATSNPSHAALSFSTNCKDCHSTDPGWKPAEYRDHDAKSFPIYSGKHNGEWNSCADCHTNPANYSQFTCIDCHTHNQGDTDGEHDGVNGYAYNSPACYGCHPNGRADGSFDHSAAGFPLTQGHASVECSKCHTSGYIGTSNICASCHTNTYTQTSNPNHLEIGISNDCKTCHTTVPDWKPASFPTHNDYYVIAGAHIPIANDCASCHNGNYVNSPKTCNGCHVENFNQTTDPNHVTSQFPTTCETCHSQNAWSPATFDHSNTYPLLGAHAAIANNCAQCHTNGYVNTPNTCYGCHASNFNQSTNPNHTAAQFPTTCAECHSQSAWTPSTFNHDGQYFPIYSGKHNGEWNSCADCHTNPSNYGEYTCTTSCHPQSSTNNEHQGIGGYQYNSPACLACHPQGSSEGSFNHATSPFPLTGGHAVTDCSSCHTNGYGSTSPVCASCHTPNYNQTSNPNHTAIGISNDCAVCHTTNPGWNPATFPTHNNYYVLAGAHIGIASQCADCHNGNYNNTPNTCAGCHINNYNQTTNPNHSAQLFPTTCETCHSQSAWVPSTFNHTSVYPLTGAHATIASNCSQCHANGYTNTPNTCSGCHQSNYNQATNPNHVALAIPNDCATCHTTNPGWAPATFPIHNNYYVLAGAHVSVACSDCHNGNYISTPNTCSGCHMTDYNQTSDPNHASAQFPTTCGDCHTQTAWIPSTFNHDAQYFPIYSGQHNGEWNACSDCHPNSTNYAIFTCTTSCHPQNSTNNDHQGISGYSYSSAACLNCHPNGNSDKMINNGLFRSN